MKLLNLNLECGKNFGPLIEFIKKYSQEIDIFCFQEVFNNPARIKTVLEGGRPNLFSELKKTLPEFNGYYAAPLEDDVGGLAIFTRKSFTVNKDENLVIFKELNKTDDEDDKDYFAMGRNLQKVELEHAGKIYSIMNFHGMWIKNSKTDTSKRLEQSQKVRRVFNESKGVKILCGDLNLTPRTKSMALLNQGNKNLIDEYKITNTVSSFDKNYGQAMDYVIVSPEAEVKDFKVLSDEVSDHLPLLLDFK